MKVREFSKLFQFLFFVIAPVLTSIDAMAQEKKTALSAEEAARKSNNPVSDAWILVTQSDLTVLEGDATGGKSEYRERISFQPVMPIPVFGGKWNLVNRLVPQIFSSPLDDDLNSSDLLGIAPSV